MLPLWIWIVGSTSIYFLIIFLSRHLRIFIVGKGEHSHNDFLDPSRQLLGLIYGVLLAFVVVFSWQSYITLSTDLDSEAVSLLNLWRDAEIFEAENREPFQQAIIDYLKTIQNEEWLLMEQGIPPNVDLAYSHLWKTASQFQAKTDTQTAFLTSLINQLNDVNSYRRARIFAVTGSTPTILWAFLIGGGFYIVMLTGLYNVPIKLRLLLSSLQALVLVFAFYLISNFDHPFEGSLALKHNSYANVLDTVTTLQKKHLD